MVGTYFVEVIWKAGTITEKNSYADVVYEKRATYRLSNGEEVIEFKTFLDNSLFLE